jgi:hypothetical protein
MNIANNVKFNLVNKYPNFKKKILIKRANYIKKYIAYILMCKNIQNIKENMSKKNKTLQNLIILNEEPESNFNEKSMEQNVINEGPIIVFNEEHIIEITNNKVNEESVFNEAQVNEVIKVNEVPVFNEVINEEPIIEIINNEVMPVFNEVHINEVINEEYVFNEVINEEPIIEIINNEVNEEVNEEVINNPMITDELLQKNINNIIQNMNLNKLNNLNITTSIIDNIDDKYKIICINKIIELISD